MPKSPKEQNLNSCIRKLRICLGTFEQPMAQAKLAQALGVSTETIKSLESRRLRKGVPSEVMMERISAEFGAVWVEEDKNWQMLPKTPYTQRQYKLWRTAKFDRVTEIDALCGGLIYLLQRVSDRQFPAASEAVFRRLSELVNQYGLSTTAREFIRTYRVAAHIWRNGKVTHQPEDLIGFEWQRDTSPSCRLPEDRERLDYRFKVAELTVAATPPLRPAKSVKRSSQQRSTRVSADGATKTSAPRIP